MKNRLVRLGVLSALLALAGCTGMSGRTTHPSACADGEASYACQVQRYHDVSA